MLSDPQNKELLIEYKKNENSLTSQLKNNEIQYYSNEVDINKHCASQLQMSSITSLFRLDTIWQKVLVVMISHCFMYTVLNVELLFLVCLLFKREM